MVQIDSPCLQLDEALNLGIFRVSVLIVQISDEVLPWIQGFWSSEDNMQKYDYASGGRKPVSMKV